MLGVGALEVMLEMGRCSVVNVVFARVLLSAVLGVHRRH